MSFGPINPRIVQAQIQQAYQRGRQEGFDAAVAAFYDPELALPVQFPKLATTPHEIKGQATTRYNCIAWAAGDISAHWWPGAPGTSFWPRGITEDTTLAAFVELFKSLGYKECDDASHHIFFEKVAIFTRWDPRLNRPAVQHAARHRPNGKWSSKLGPYVLIEHEYEAVAGHNASEYGDIAQLMMRRRGIKSLFVELFHNWTLRNLK